MTHDLDWHYLLSRPRAKADFKSCHQDFIVDEQLGFDLSGEGEHLCLQVVKKGENTHFVAKQIAQHAQQPLKNVSYAGLKDRHGVCSQWFSVPVAIKQELDFTVLNSESLCVVQQVRHHKKLRTGCHKGNSFKITLRNITKLDDLISRVNAVRNGVPNYFGPQRFGHDGHNLCLAERLFTGEMIRDRRLRGLVISAARSYIFNQVLSQRVKSFGLERTLPEEVFMLAGSRAFFKEPVGEESLKRLAEQDIILSAPMAGRGEKALSDYERNWLKPHKNWIEGLVTQGLKTERRAIKLIPKDLTVSEISKSSVVIEFSLEKGCFATSVLRELVRLNTAVEMGDSSENIIE